MTTKYGINPNSGRPIQLFSKQYYHLVKKNILKDKFVTADVIAFDKNEDAELINKVKKGMKVKTGSFITAYKDKLVRKNNKLSTEQLLEYIIENYPNILENSLDVIKNDDDDETIKKKFTEILHNKLLCS
jgi:exosome complex RNA-binding protein Rrp4